MPSQQNAALLEVRRLISSPPTPGKKKTIGFNFSFEKISNNDMHANASQCALAGKHLVEARGLKRRRPSARCLIGYKIC
jgi:hypothetical protein